jgi:hypothetical protein
MSCSPALRWIQAGPDGVEVASRVLDAGYRARVVPSIDDRSFAAVYVDPGPERAPRWTVYDLATGERHARLAPTVSAAFLVHEGRVFAEVTTGGVAAFDQETGAEVWRVGR